MAFTNLNSEQNKAVEHIDGPVLILAGAGSGKTATMTHRMAHMIELGIDPHNILAVTFTNKAANEMRERVNKLVSNTQGMWVMTFHAMCLRMLRYSAESIGYKSGFTVYDETDKKSLIKRILKEKEIDEKQVPVALIIAIISKCKELEQDPEEYRASNFVTREVNIVYEVYRSYQAELMNNNAMDFDDLLWNGVKLLEQDGGVLAYYSNRFQYIMVDEYQDTNYLQYKLIKLLASGHGNLCVVGDDDQCIYQWRGADIRNILDFENDFKNVFTVKLEQNYRSDANILNLANSVIKKNIGRKSKSLWTDREAGEKITYRRLENEKLEASYVAREIEKLHSEGYSYSDIAVLYRKNAQSRSFEEKFSFWGVPYRVLAGLRYYDRKEIKDIMSYLRLIDNPNDDVSMLRIVNEPKRGMGPKSLASVEQYAHVYGISVYQALCEEQVQAGLGNKSKQAIKELVEMIQELRAEQDNLTLSAIYDNVLNRSGYLAALEAAGTIEADGRIENLMEFKSVIAEFEKDVDNGTIDEFQAELRAEQEALLGEGYRASEPSMLGAFLERITLMADIDNHDEDEEAVVLMTLHSAKGLEFPVVFMPGMENNVFPGASAFESEDKMEEERRLCYVGITRAMKKLYLTGAELRTLYGRTDYSTESQFLDEMDKKYLDGDKTAKQKAATETGSYLGGYSFGGHVSGTADGFGREAKGNPWARSGEQAEFQKHSFYGSGSRSGRGGHGAGVDGLSQSKKQTEEKIVDDFSIGDTLVHPKFGEGMLIEQDERTMTIIFDSVGQKKLGKGFIKMTKK